MASWIALLRAVNVGGTGKLPMADLTAMCQALGWQQVQTYIASGNVVFGSAQTAPALRQALEASLAAYASKTAGKTAGAQTGVVLRSAAEMAAVLAANPFPGRPGNRVLVSFLNDPLPQDTVDAVMAGVSGRKDERIVPTQREIYVDYGDGMAGSRLRIAAAANGTARNINTVAKLAAMATSLTSAAHSTLTSSAAPRG